MLEIVFDRCLSLESKCTVKNKNNNKLMKRK